MNWFCCSSTSCAFIYILVIISKFLKYETCQDLHFLFVLVYYSYRKETCHQNDFVHVYSSYLELLHDHHHHQQQQIQKINILVHDLLPLCDVSVWQVASHRKHQRSVSLLRSHVEIVFPRVDLLITQESTETLKKTQSSIWASLTFWTVEVSSKHSWMILPLVEVKSLALDRGVLARKEKLNYRIMSVLADNKATF